MTNNTLLVTGAKGQLGQTIVQHWPDSSLCRDHQLVLVDIDELDLTRAAEVTEFLSAAQPTVIINAAAYTAVDLAESERETAFAVNESGVENLACWAATNHCRLINVSTDFVFDGSSDSPYLPDAAPAPLSVYGESKLAGERQLSRLLPEQGLTIRTSWLYSEYGNNFVKTMLRLMSERDRLAVVSDQVGSPTSTHSLVRLIFSMMENWPGKGLYHWTDGAAISWYEFAEAIQAEGLDQGLLQSKIAIDPIASSEYPTPARRPAYSVLDRSATLAEFDCPQQDWRRQLSKVIKTIVNTGENTQ